VKYSMVFALASEDLGDVVLLRKPEDHKNPLFRGRWTVPGGAIESGESDAEGAARELSEEAGILVSAGELIPILRFYCNCDPTESEHEVVVFGVRIDSGQRSGARGTPTEPIVVERQLPDRLLWYIEPLLALVKARMRQPL
jgi:8-oxo-dGTP pyrophosphatase MutT (NUDIX family)